MSRRAEEIDVPRLPRGQAARGQATPRAVPGDQDENCGEPLTGLEPDRVVAGFVTLEIRELVIEGSRRGSFLRGLITCGVSIDEPADGPQDLGTAGNP